jgi:hypothetical protein
MTHTAVAHTAVAHTAVTHTAVTMTIASAVITPAAVVTVAAVVPDVFALATVATPVGSAIAPPGPNSDHPGHRLTSDGRSDQSPTGPLSVDRRHLVPQGSLA